MIPVLCRGLLAAVGIRQRELVVRHEETRADQGSRPELPADVAQEVPVIRAAEIGIDDIDDKVEVAAARRQQPVALLLAAESAERNDGGIEETQPEFSLRGLFRFAQLDAQHAAHPVAVVRGISPRIKIHAADRPRVHDRRDRLEVLEVIGLVEPQAVEQEQHLVDLAATDVVSRRDAAVGRSRQPVRQAHGLFGGGGDSGGQFPVEIGVGQGRRIIEPVQARRHDNLRYRHCRGLGSLRGGLDLRRQSHHQQAVGRPGRHGQPVGVQQLGQPVRRYVSGRLVRQPHVPGNEVARVDDPRALGVQEIEIVGECPALPGDVRRGQPE